MNKNEEFNIDTLRLLNMVGAIIDDYIEKRLSTHEADEVTRGLISQLVSMSDAEADYLTDALIAAYLYLPHGTLRDAFSSLSQFEQTRELIIQHLVKLWHLKLEPNRSLKIMKFLSDIYDLETLPEHKNSSARLKVESTNEFVRRAILREVRNAIPIYSPHDYEPWILSLELKRPIRELFAEARARAGGLDLAIHDILSSSRAQALSDLNATVMKF